MQLEHALLLFFAQQYQDAWQEVGCVLASERAAGEFEEEELERVRMLWEKLRLLLEFEC